MRERADEPLTRFENGGARSEPCRSGRTGLGKLIDHLLELDAAKKIRPLRIA
jgi:hypothetical protein